MTENEALWTVKEVAKFLRVSTSWIYKAAASGRLPVRRYGALVRFDPDAIRRGIAQPDPGRRDLADTVGGPAPETEGD